MKIQRIDDKTGQAIYCSVPPMLPGDVLDKIDEVSLEYKIKVESFFPLRWFLSRYMAGRHSLKESRQVSRKRLALVGSGVGFVDSQAQVLFDQMQRYNQAVDSWKAAFDSTLDIKSLVNCNEVIAPEVTKPTRIRDGQNWIGAKTVVEARYVCPPPDMVAEYVDNFISYVNSEHQNELIASYIAHCRLLAIHPFWDGNGRSARAMFDGFLEHKFGSSVNPLLYRMSPKCKLDSYLEAIELFDIGSEDAILHAFWSESNDWIHHYASYSNGLIVQARKLIMSKIGLKAISKSTLKLLEHLWQQPVVCFAGLMSLFDKQAEDIQIAITELTQVGVLEVRKLREPRNAVIYDCPIIMNLYHELDSAIAQV